MDFKPQDLLFIAVFLLLLIKRDPRYFAIAGLICIGISVPLFSQWVFFTAQRLVWFAFLFFSFAVILNLIKLRHNK